MTAKKRGRKPNADVFNGAPMGAEYTPGGGNRFQDDLLRKFLPGTEQARIFLYCRDAYLAEYRAEYGTARGAFDAYGRHKQGSAAAGEAIRKTVQKFPGRASSPGNRARAIQKIVESGERALAFVIPWQTLHAEPFQDAYSEAVVRLRLAKGVMAARPASTRRTEVGGVTGETATKLLKTPTLSKAEVALLEQPGAFEKEAPGALASALAGALLDVTDEAKAAESAANAAEARAKDAETRLENIKRDLETGDPDRSVIALLKSLKQHLPQ